MTAARVLLVDNHPIVSESIRWLLRDQPEFQVVGAASETEGAWAAVVELKPDLIVLDLELPGAGGVALAKRLRLNYPDIKVVILTGHAELQFINETLRAGVHGYVLKTDACGQLPTALQTVLAGHRFLSQEISTRVAREYRTQIGPNRDRSSALSTRELDVLKRVAEGQTSRRIACELGIGSRTVENDRRRLRAKLGFGKVVELTKYALREGLIAR